MYVWKSKSTSSHWSALDCASLCKPFSSWTNSNRCSDLWHCEQVRNFPATCIIRFEHSHIVMLDKKNANVSNNIVNRTKPLTTMHSAEIYSFKVKVFRVKRVGICCVAYSSILLESICTYIPKCDAHRHTLPPVRWFHWFPNCLHSCKWKVLSADYNFIYWFRMHWATLRFLQHFIELFTNAGHAHLLLSSPTHRSIFLIFEQ